VYTVHDATRVEPESVEGPLTETGTTGSGDPAEAPNTVPEDTTPARPVSDAALAPGDGEGPLIGQGEAAEALRTGTERAFTVGTPTLVALQGERGAGKTRLLVYASEFAARIAPDVRILYGTCREGGTDGSYAPFSRLVLERFGVTPASAPSAVRAQMLQTVGDILQWDDAIRTAETTHLLGHLAGVPFPDSPFLTRLQEQPDELHRRTVSAVRALLEGDAQRRPVLLLIDDFHHAEQEAWDVLRELAQAEAHLALVLAGSSPLAEWAEQAAPEGGFAAGPIAPLGESEVASMLHVLLPSLQYVPEPLVAAVTHRSGGNPSAVRELVFALQEAGIFRETDDGELEVDLAQLESGELPVSMTDATQARLARLDPFEHATLARAAVVGERFWEGALIGQMRSEREPPGDQQDPVSIWPHDEDADALLAALDRLQEKGFLVESEMSDLPGTRELHFAIPAARTLLYERQDEELRTARHAAVARWLSLVGQLHREGVAAMIAPHLEKAEQPSRAGRAYLEAAVYEHAQLRTTTALRYVEQALQLLPQEDVVRRVEALHEHGSLLTLVGRYDEAIDAFTQMLRHAWNIGARGKGGAALNRIARVHRHRGEDAEARRHLDRALELFRAAGDLRGVAASLDDLAQLQLRQGELDPALEATHEALEIRRAHGDQRGEALSLHTIGLVELSRGELDVAEQTFRQAAELRRAIGDHEGTLRSENALGALALERGDPDTAIASWRAALEQARAMADRQSECVLLDNLGEALRLTGRYEQSEQTLAEAKSLADTLGDRRTLADVERNRGLLALARGQDGAEELLADARELAEHYGGAEATALAHRAIGALRAQTLFDSEGETDRRAEESFLTSIDLFRELGNEKEAARSLAELGRHLIERGDLETARERLHEARAIMRRIGLADLKRVDSTLAELE
jgi:tetratricopeptide (TPR) repeat protein